MKPKLGAAPCARTERILVREIEDEVLLYDVERHRAHSLNRTAAFVWRRANGRRSPREIARLLAAECGSADAGNIVDAALDDLARAGLLAGGAASGRAGAGVSRREAARKIGAAAAALLPIVVSIVAPTAAEAAASCVPPGQSCRGFCSGSGNPFRCPACCSGLCSSSFRCL